MGAEQPWFLGRSGPMAACTQYSATARTTQGRRFSGPRDCFDEVNTNSSSSPWTCSVAVTSRGLSNSTPSSSM